MDQVLFDYIVKKTTEVFEVMAITNKVKTKTSSLKNIFGARIKANNNTVEVGIILEDATISFRLSSGHCSFIEDYCNLFDTQAKFDEEFPKIKSYVDNCFNKLKLKKKI
jgi:hypothetical protein